MILLFSGGIDSYIAYHYLGKPPTLYFNLNTRYSIKEMRVVKRLIPDTIIEKCIDFKDKEDPITAFIPYRNLHLALLANQYSDTIVIAGVKDDRVNDKNEVVFQKFSKLMSDMTNKKIMVMSPFWGSTKEQIVGWYLKNGGIKEALLSTISCYSSEDILFCGKCPACFRKWCALKANGIDDLIFTNDKLMWNYYDKAVEGSYYDPDRNRNIIEQVLKIHPNWEGLW